MGTSPSVTASDGKGWRTFRATRAQPDCPRQVEQPQREKYNLAAMADASRRLLYLIRRRG